MEGVRQALPHIHSLNEAADVLCRVAKLAENAACSARNAGKYRDGTQQNEGQVSKLVSARVFRTERLLQKLRKTLSDVSETLCKMCDALMLNKDKGGEAKSATAPSWNDPGEQWWRACTKELLAAHEKIALRVSDASCAFDQALWESEYYAAVKVVTAATEDAAQCVKGELRELNNWIDVAEAIADGIPEMHALVSAPRR